MSSRRFAPLVLVLALVLGAPGYAQVPQGTVPAADPAGAPRAVFEKTEIDAGEVARGQELPFAFVVRNTGDAVLKILSAKPG